MVNHNLKSGDLVFIQKQTVDSPGLMLELSGIAHVSRDQQRIHVIATAGQASFPVDLIHSTTREESTGKIWVYLK